MPDKAEEIFNKAGAVLEGHFLLTSGLHSSLYWEKFRVLQFPGYTEQLCRMIAEHFRGQGVQVVAGPTVGGIILAHEIARQMGLRSIYAEKKGGDNERIFRRGLSLAPGEKVLVVDDILTTGKSVHQVMSAVAKAGGTVVGIGVLIDRSERDPAFGVPLFSCHRSETITYRPPDCPLCAAGIPLVKPGSSRQAPGKN